MFYKNPQYGDIIVASKSSFNSGEPIIKRVIATEGQEVNIDFGRGIVYVDGVPLDEPYITAPTTLFEGVSFPLVVDKGCVFVMGDNRNHSTDSRDSMVGMVPEKYVIGEAVFRFMPFDSVGFLNQEETNE